MVHRFRSLSVAAVLTAGLVGITLAAGRLQATPEGTQQAQQAPQGQEPQKATGEQGRDSAAARTELVQARQTLMELIALPESMQLSGPVRTQVNQVIGSFNSLVTDDSTWYDRYREMQLSLSPLTGGPASDEGATGSAGQATGMSGQASGTSLGQPVGTSGIGPADVPARVKDKLVQFRNHMVAFAEAAGVPSASGAAAPPHPAPTTGREARGSGSSSLMGSPGQTQGRASAAAGSPASASPGETMQEHLDAISDLLLQALNSRTVPSGAAGTSGTWGSGMVGTSGTSGAIGQASSSAGTVAVDRATLTEMQAHLQRLRDLAREKGIR